MDKKTLNLIIALAVIIVAGVFIYTISRPEQAVAPQNLEQMQNPPPPQQQDSRLIITSPQNGATVGTSFTIQGQAQGWFEGHVPITVFDSNNTLLYSGNATVADNYGQFQSFTKAIALTATPTVNTGRIEFTELSNADGVTVTYQKIINVNF